MEGSSHHSRSHSRSYSHHSRSHSKAQVFSGPAATFSGSKKPPLFPGNAGNGGFFTTSYDDVFGGPPTFATLAPRAEDYSEIFGAFRSSSASRASSIPLLDLPAVADIDAGASFLDYSEVFGGFDAVDFAVPYDELFRPFDAGDCSSDEAWTPVGSESLSDDSDPFACSEKSPCFSDGNSHQSVDGKQLNVSYHQVNPGSSTSVPNMTHVAQLNVVPGYTCVVDEPRSVTETGKERFCSTIDDDIILSVEPSPFMSQKHADKNMSQISRDDAALRSSNGDHKPGRGRSASMGTVNLTSSSVSDINHRTETCDLPPPFRPPPVQAGRKEDFSRLKPDPRGSENCPLDADADGSVSSFDMEVDASSSAAVSAAAIKDAMNRAQAKLKAAKVLMDKKKDSPQSGEVLGLKTDINDTERVHMGHSECASKDETLEASGYREPAKSKISGDNRHARSVSLVLPNSSAVEQRTGIAERKKEKKLSSVVDTAFTGQPGEWKEATQYYEFVNSDIGSLHSQRTSNVDGKTAAGKQSDDDDKHSSDSADEACVPEENRRRLKAVKAVSRQEFYQKIVKVAQEVHESMIGGHPETEKGLGGVPQGNSKQQKGKLKKSKRQSQQVMNESITKEGDEIRLNAPEREEIKHKEIASCHSEHIGRNRGGLHQTRIEEAFESKDDERKMRGSSECLDSEGKMREPFLREGNEQRAKEAFETQRNDKKPAGTPKHKINNGSSEGKNNKCKEAFDAEFGGKVPETACQSQENDLMRDLLQRKVENNRKKEDCDNVVDAERLPKTRQSQKVEDDRSKEAVEDIFGGDKLERTLWNQQDAMDLDESRKYEVPEQEKLSQRLDDAQKFVYDNKKPEKNQKQETTDAGIEKSANGQVESESVPPVELEEACKVPDNSGDDGNLADGNRSQMKLDQIDEEQSSDSSPEIELPVKDGNLELPNGAKLNGNDIDLDDLGCDLKNPQMEDCDSLEVPVEENMELSSASSNKESMVKAVETADLTDERQMKTTVSEVDNGDRDQGRAVHAPDASVGVEEGHDPDAPHTRASSSTSGGVCTGKSQIMNDENKKFATSVFDTKLAKDLKIEREEKRNVQGEAEALCYKEEKVRSIPSEGICRGNEQLRKKEAVHTAMPERKESVQKRSELPSGGQSTETKAEIIMEEKRKENERDLELEQLRKLEEEKEREREREKDRMAVEIAIREARERAYADARDRAERAALERATDEARQRAMAEARERLEKACAEARERSQADKASEARLRVERAAVVQATAEARQRAIDKAKAERVTLEARERMQRSVSEKYSSEREAVMRQSSMPSMSDRYEDGEPVQRCKARLERHRRTVERVAKALAEKNMRDLIAQREQAERNRFAETLDADIKRWSSGKEGNLRALLSTLQYILGPDSGWQPIPLTEVITAAAVKKAYRKATLCVHPDKLQQRGASVQQKYICEKVFDLLKEAWNRFNSEEK